MQRRMFFDNLSVQHRAGPITEETHYYPFGLTMAGISSKAVGRLEKKFGFNGIEQNTDFELNMYDAFYRNLDPQLGRFWQIDPKSIDEVFPYSAMLNNPLTHFDQLGDTTMYYDVAGNLLYQTNVKGYRNAFIVNNEYLNNAKGFLSSLGNDLSNIEQFLVDAVFALGNRNQELGTAYDLQSISEFYEENVSKEPIKSIQGTSIDDMTSIKIDGNLYQKILLRVSKEPKLL